MVKIENAIVKCLYYVCALLMLLMVAVVTAQVISRYVFGNPFTWTEELGRYTFVWLSMLGMTIAIKYGSHIALDILVKKLRGVPQKSLMILNHLFVLTFAVILTYSGMNIVQLGTKQSSPSLGLPMEFVYIVIPISGILMMYFVFNEILRIFQQKEGDL